MSKTLSGLLFGAPGMCTGAYTGRAKSTELMYFFRVRAYGSVRMNLTSAPFLFFSMITPLRVWKEMGQTSGSYGPNRRP